VPWTRAEIIHLFSYTQAEMSYVGGIVGREYVQGKCPVLLKFELKTGLHTRTVVRERCKGDDAKSMGKLEIQPLATPKPLNRSSQKVAHVLMSWISTHMQNLVMILKGFLFSVCAKLRLKDVYSVSFFPGFFQRPITAQAPEPIFTHNTLNDAVPRKDVPFRG